ncbi:MAG: ATP/GTP-binding protein [Spirochaetales bacterium]|nr:MAG: ATP/GTP-binding protein [Spirochaetales bacterium]
MDTSWAIGLHAPKGMGIKGTTLFVTDIDRIHAIDTASGKIMKSHDVEGARFLNDIAVDEEGGVYVTDMETNRLHLLKNDVLSVWLELKDFKRPNGLYIEGKVLFVGTGQGVLKIDTALKSVVMEVPHAGGIDGLRRYGRGAFIVSDWKGKTELIARGRNAVLLVDTTAGNINAADLEYIPEKRLLIIPTFFDNRVVAYTLGK